jgi:hypothetical protein
MPPLRPAIRPAIRPASRRFGWGVSLALHLAVLGAMLTWRIPAPAPPDERTGPIVVTFMPAAYQPAVMGFSAHPLPAMELSSADFDLPEDAPSAEAEEDPPAVAGRPDVSAARELGGDYRALSVGAGGGAQGRSGRLRGGGTRRGGGGQGGGSEGGLVYRLEYRRVPACLRFELLIFPPGSPQAQAIRTSHGSEYVSFGSDSVPQARAAIGTDDSFTAAWSHQQRDAGNGCDLSRSDALSFSSFLDHELGAAWRGATPVPGIPAGCQWLRLVISPGRGHLTAPARAVGVVPPAGFIGRGFASTSCFPSQYQALDTMLEMPRSYGLDPHWTVELVARDIPRNVMRVIIRKLAGQADSGGEAVAAPWSSPWSKADLATWIARLDEEDRAGRGSLTAPPGASPVHSP